jgi:catechol 2,3-dioxygenase-like lactoylglutathione lyase family enzyme
MNVALANVGAITLFVADAQRSKSFYANVFELEPVFEDEVSTVFKFENTLVNLLELPAAEELVAPADVAPDATGSRFQLTIWVDDANAVSADLATRGVELVNGPMDREWGVRTACFADPDGHLWEIAQNLAPSGS